MDLCGGIFYKKRSGCEVAHIRFFLLLIFFRNEIQGNAVPAGVKLGEFDTGSIQHPLGCQITHGVIVLIRKVENFFDAALNNGLGAFVTGEQCNEDAAVAEASAVGIQNGIQLSVNNIGILGLLTFPLPGKFVI